MRVFLLQWFEDLNYCIYVCFDFIDISCIEEQDGIGRTALIYAVHFHELDILKCLLESGAEVNATAHGKCCIMYCVPLTVQRLGIYIKSSFSWFSCVVAFNKTPHQQLCTARNSLLLVLAQRTFNVLKFLALKDLLMPWSCCTESCWTKWKLDGGHLTP